MKKLVMATALAAALGACSQTAEEADDTAATETPAAEESVAAESSAGTYEVALEGGGVRTSVLAPDGTYSDTENGEVVESGTWEDREGKVCFDPQAEEPPAMCYTIGETAADGTFTATPDEGDPLTVKKIS